MAKICFLIGTRNTERPPQSTEIRAKIKREWIAQGGNAATSELEI